MNDNNTIKVFGAPAEAGATNTLIAFHCLLSQYLIVGYARRWRLCLALHRLQNTSNNYFKTINSIGETPKITAFSHIYSIGRLAEYHVRISFTSMESSFGIV